jgi:hypothetical protein
VYMYKYMVKFILFTRAYDFTLQPIRFVLRSIQTHISMRNCFNICVCTLLKANIMNGRVSACALKGKKNISVSIYVYTMICRKY